MTTDPTPDRAHRATLTVTVTSRADGGHYFDGDDFSAHVAGWIKADLRGHHAIAEVTTCDQSAELARAQAEAHQYRTALQGVARREAATAAAPDQTLRDRVAEALYERERPPRDPHWPDVYACDREVFEAQADAVLAAILGPIPVGADTATWTTIRAIQLMNEAGQQRDAVLAVLPTGGRARVSEVEGDEGDELVCVDECGLCDACGMEPFGTPAEGWREAARFLRRTARESSDRQGALHGARLIEAELRRLAAGERDEQQTQQDGAETRPARGDQFEAWLKAQRDEYGPGSLQWPGLDDLLDLYRLHADTDTPLGEHVCEGRVAGDCECLEQPTPPAVVAEPGKETDAL